MEQTVPASCEEPARDGSEPCEGVELAHRSPLRAALYSALGIGCGQIYNKQLEKAVLLWFWVGILASAGLLLLALGTLGRLIPPAWVRPPLGDVVADYSGTFAVVWVSAVGMLWLINVYDALVSAGRINRREVVIRYGMRRQLVHVLASQLLGFLPLVGVLFPPAVVAEAIDCSQDRRGPDGKRLLREGGQAVLEWALTRLAVYALAAFGAVWLLWWIGRGIARIWPFS